MSNENRWHQRLQNLNKAFLQLSKGCSQKEYNDLEIAGLVQTYEFTFELAWKTMKDKLMFDGYDVRSPRETIKKAFDAGLIEDVELWLEALETRNLFSSVYENEIAEQAIELIKHKFFPMLRGSIAILDKLAGNP